MIVRILLACLVTGVLLCTPVLVNAQEDDESTVPDLTIHVVQRGENLFGIAVLYDTSVDVLAQLNGLFDVNHIAVGQRLLVPTAAAYAQQTTHVVQPGETLSSIAHYYGITVDDLISRNNIPNANQIYSGQELAIESANSLLFPDIPPGPDNGLVTLSSTLHTVAAGETLYQIAVQYNLTVQDLQSANSLEDPTAIIAGQQIMIPAHTMLTAQLDIQAPVTSIDVSPLIFTEGETGSIVIHTDTSAVVNGRFLGHDLRIIPTENNTSHAMLIAVPLFTEEGIYPIQFLIASANNTSSQFAFNIRVMPGEYETQNIEVTEELQTLLAPAVQDNERTILERVTGSILTNRMFEGPFSLPAAAALNGEFGTRRSYNGGPVESFHSGSDFAAPPETPIYAAAPGKVVLADLLNIRGNTIVLDHGWGVYTVYAHLDTLNVTIGDTVTTGHTIGFAGSSGRVTGPHLHWEVWVNGTPVNPVQWTQRTFP